jgi:hypothetical protein
MNRDDQCEPPPEKELLDDFPNNRNGSLCLNFKCTWANVTVGQECIVENTAYIAYDARSEFAFVVSRGNCRPGLYCDASITPHVCAARKELGAACSADKECISNNCLGDDTCGTTSDAAAHFPTWVYIAVAAGILGGMLITIIGLFFVHKRTRDAEREKRTQYWREQTAFRQNILQMQETARNGYVRDPNDPPSQIQSGDSQIPMLPGKMGGMRNMSDDDRDDGDYGLINSKTPRGRMSRHGYPKR